MSTQREVDPITFSVILSRFDAIVNEMTLTLEGSAWTSILAICRDFSCAIYDAVPRQISMYDALPIHTTSMHLVLQQIARSFEGEVNDGDVYLCNDPYSFNTHVGDLVTACPVFVDGRHLFWAVTKGHQLDTGAFVASSVTASSENVWQEGLQIPPLKLYDRGVERRDVTALYLANMRYRELLEGDLLAQLGSIETGRKRLIELAQTYGADETLGYVDAIIDYADRRMSEQLEAIPDGEYTAEGWVDSDGFTELDIPIRVTVTVAGDRVRVDYTGSGPQARGGVNSSYATAQATGAIPFLYYCDPDIPHNDGCIRHIEVYAPEGTITNARYPGSTSCATAIPTDVMHDVVNKAMAAAIPDRVPGGGTRQQNIPQLSGIDPETGEEWAVMLFNGTGGSGGSKGTDGWPLFESMGGFGAVKTQSVEQIELLYPVRVEQMEIEPESMGLGASLGGPGVRLVVAALGGEMECITFGDAYRNPPHGVLGGTPGIGGGAYVESGDEGPRTFVSASGRVQVAPGGRWVGVSTGGGGYGRPSQREPERVRDDVANGLYSAETARVVFGVVLDEALAIDAPATEEARAELGAQPYAVVEPTTPGAGAWLDQMLRDGDTFLLNPL